MRLEVVAEGVGEWISDALFRGRHGTGAVRVSDVSSFVDKGGGLSTLPPANVDRLMRTRILHSSVINDFIGI